MFFCSCLNLPSYHQVCSAFCHSFCFVSFRCCCCSSTHIQHSHFGPFVLAYHTCARLRIIYCHFGSKIKISTATLAFLTRINRSKKWELKCCSNIFRNAYCSFESQRITYIFRCWFSIYFTSFYSMTTLRLVSCIFLFFHRHATFSFEEDLNMNIGCIVLPFAESHIRLSFQFIFSAKYSTWACFT